MCIGQEVWVFDENRRVYQRNEAGRAVGGPIWREHWRRAEVIGETSRSWIVGYNADHELFRVAKKEWPAGLCLSEEDIDKAAFVQTRHAIADRARRCVDYDTLKAISDLLDAWESK